MDGQKIIKELILLSNVEFEKLFRQFEPMIIKLCRKWSRLNIIEFDELMQISLLALMEAYKTFDETRGTKFSTYVYNTIEYRIRKEIYITNRKNKRYKTISIYSTIESAEGDTTELIDLIANDLDLEEEIYNKMVLKAYEDEIRKYITDPNKLEVCLLKWFNSCSYNYIEKVTGVNNISGTLIDCRLKLIQRSKLFRQEYNKIHHINEYNPTAAII